MDGDDYEAMKDMADPNWPQYFCRACRQGRCEDCMSLGVDCPCCGRRSRE